MTDAIKSWRDRERDRKQAIEDAESALKRYGDPPKESNTGNADYDDAYNRRLRERPRTPYR